MKLPKAYHNLAIVLNNSGHHVEAALGSGPLVRVTMHRDVRNGR